MAKILGADAGKLTLGDAFMIAGVKTFEERFLANYIGNATVFSGTAKIIGAIAINKFVGGKVGDIVGTALVVDGTEDVINALLGGNLIPTLTGGVQSGNSVTVM